VAALKYIVTKMT